MSKDEHNFIHTLMVINGDAVIRSNLLIKSLDPSAHSIQAIVRDLNCYKHKGKHSIVYHMYNKNNL